MVSSASVTVLGRRRLTVRVEDAAIDTAGVTTLLCSTSIVLARRVQSLVFRFVECDLESTGLSVNGKKRMGAPRRVRARETGSVVGKAMNEILEKSGDEARREEE